MRLAAFLKGLLPGGARRLQLPRGIAHFYDLDVGARQRLVETAAARRQTLVARWQYLGQEQTAAWGDRAQRAAQLLGPQPAVVDVGCGMMTLERYLAPGTTYLPVDVVRRDARTVVVDLNRQPLPDFDAPALAGLGLLEYLYDVPGLLRQIASRYQRAVLSYNPLDNVPDRAARTGHAWVSHLTIAELEAAFAAAGLTIESRVQHDATQTLWSLRGSVAASGGRC